MKKRPHFNNAINSKILLNKPVYDLIILDWLMPEMNGIETAEQIWLR